MNGIITTIQRMSLHDGPGIRSTIFLKGCNFRCMWCHNPETYSSKQQLEFIKSKCIGCEECLKIQPDNSMGKINNSIVLKNSHSKNIKLYDGVCFSEALNIVGEYVSVDEVFERVKIDFPYFKNSGGGITISGGEPLMQPEFCKHLLKKFKNSSIHTAIETNLSFPWNYYKNILPNIDLMFVDLKSMNASKHNEWIGQNNSVILENLINLDNTGINYIIRTPIIPSFNDDKYSIMELCEFISGLNRYKYYELIPFHSLAESKYENLGLINPMQNATELTKNDLNKFYDIINEYKIRTKK